MKAILTLKELNFIFFIDPLVIYNLFEKNIRLDNLLISNIKNIVILQQNKLI